MGPVLLALISKKGITIPACSVLRKVAAGTYIGGYLFYIYLGWLPNGTITICYYSYIV